MKVSSLPTRGAWIEIITSLIASTIVWSLPTRGAWIEIFIFLRSCSKAEESLPTRGAWIEMDWKC